MRLRLSRRAAGPASSAHKWAVAAVLAVAAAINYADRAAIAAVFPLLRAELSLSDVALASLGSAFLWCYALCSPVSGLLADRLSRSRLVVLSLAAWSLIAGLTGSASTLWQLILLRAALGAAESLYLPAATALLADWHGTETRATAMSIHSVGLNLGLVGGGTAAGYLGDRFGWRPGFWLLGLTGLGFALPAWWILRRGADRGNSRGAKPAAARVLETLGELSRIPSYLLLLGKAVLAGVGVWIFFNWLPLFYRESFGLSLASAGFAGTFMLQSATTLGIACGGVLSDRLAKRRTRYRVLLQSFSYLAAAPFLLVFLGRPGLKRASAGIFCFSFFRGVGQSNENPVLCDVVPPRLRSTAIGFMNTGACIAGGAGVMVTGLLKASLGLAGVFAAVGGLFVLAAGLLLIGYLFFLERDIRRQLLAAGEPAPTR